jgi:hypothetical protein
MHRSTGLRSKAFARQTHALSHQLLTLFIVMHGSYSLASCIKDPAVANFFAMNTRLLALDDTGSIVIRLGADEVLGRKAMPSGHGDN